MASEPKQMYECSACERLHEFHHRAEECCAPEVAMVWVCGDCEAAHDSKAEAEACCAALALNGQVTCTCPDCYRDFDLEPMQQAAITIAGHCTTCNPLFTIEQQLAIEDLHQLETGLAARLNV
jgi:hypothetical protein